MTLGDRVAVLRKGLLQQVDSPRTLYEHPVNMFVAGFIGSPPMNFIPGEAKNGTLELPFVSFALPNDMRTAIGDRQYVMVGIRPERFDDVRFVDPMQVDQGVRFRARVDVVEWLGNEQFAYVPYDAPPDLTAGLSELAKELDSERMRSQLVIALDPSSEIHDGSDAEFWFDPNNMHIFDAADHANLTSRVAVAA